MPHTALFSRGLRPATAQELAAVKEALRKRMRLASTQAKVKK
ncbi:MAG: hypothetical protein WCI04_00830 [archaeon]